MDMLEQGKFMELLAELTELARVQEDTITKEEVQAFLSEMKIDETQLEHVYRYLGENGIQIPGIRNEKTETSPLAEPEEEKESVAYRFYKEEMQAYESLSPAQKTRLFLGVRNKEAHAKEQILSGYLPVVMGLAERYKGKGMPVEDLIQEGNIGLLLAIEKIAEIANIEDADTFLVESIRQAIVEAVDEEISGNDWEQTVVAKTSLIHEAAKYLAEDLGRVATVQELADYTRIPEAEIDAVLKLSLDAVKVGKGE